MYNWGLSPEEHVQKKCLLLNTVRSISDMNIMVCSWAVQHQTVNQGRPNTTPIPPSLSFDHYLAREWSIQLPGPHFHIMCENSKAKNHPRGGWIEWCKLIKIKCRKLTMDKTQRFVNEVGPRKA